MSRTHKMASLVTKHLTPGPMHCFFAWCPAPSSSSSTWTFAPPPFSTPVPMTTRKHRRRRVWKKLKIHEKKSKTRTTGSSLTAWKRKKNSFVLGKCHHGIVLRSIFRRTVRRRRIHFNKKKIGKKTHCVLMPVRLKTSTHNKLRKNAKHVHRYNYFERRHSRKKVFIFVALVPHGCSYT